MGKLIFNTSDEGREKLKAMYVALGGSAEEWGRKMAKLDRERIESLEEISYIMRQRPHYGKRKPG